MAQTFRALAWVVGPADEQHDLSGLINTRRTCKILLVDESPAALAWAHVLSRPRVSGTAQIVWRVRYTLTQAKIFGAACFAHVCAWDQARVALAQCGVLAPVPGVQGVLRSILSFSRPELGGDMQAIAPPSCSTFSRH